MECFELLRKFVLTSGFMLLFNTASKESGIQFFMTIAVVALVALQNAWPYKVKWNAWLASSCSIALAWIGLVGSTLYLIDDDNKFQKGTRWVNGMMAFETLVYMAITYMQYRQGQRELDDHSSSLIQVHREVDHIEDDNDDSPNNIVMVRK